MKNKYFGVGVKKIVYDRFSDLPNMKYFILVWY